MSRTTTTSKQLKPGDHFITVTRGIRGWFAVEMWLNDRDIEGNVFWEPWQSDDLSYRTEEEARVRAIRLAGWEDLPYLVEGEWQS